MQSVPAKWYQLLNYALGAASLLIIGIYVLADTTLNIESDVFGINIVTLGLAAVTALHSLLGFMVTQKRSNYFGGLITYILFTLLTLGLILSSGNYDSPLFFLWIVVVFISGAFGVISIAVVMLATLTYLGAAFLGLVGDAGNVNMGMLIGAISIATALVSLEVWRHSYSRSNDEQTNKLSKQLQTEKIQSEILINAIADGMIAVDKNGKIQVFNPGAEKITGWSASEALELDYTIIMKLFKVDGDQEAPLDQSEDPFKKAQLKQQSVVSEPILHTKNDRSLELSLTVSPINADGEVQGLVAIFRDVSEQKKQERQRTEFISTASHEMRTPVAAIEGYLSLAMNDKVANIDSKAMDLLTKAHESTQHLGQLFKDLLAAAKSEDGRIQSHPQVIEMGEFLTKLAEDLRFTAEEKGLRLDFAVATGNNSGEQIISPLFYVNVDPERIREVITNLVNNAVKFTEKGSVTIGLRGEKDTVQISVKDTGLGIPEEDIPHLFQKFYRVDNSATRTIGGTGLGLFISRNIIELYNGRIWVDSKVNEGSTFYINLPRLTSQQADDLKRQQELVAPEVTLKPNSI